MEAGNLENLLLSKYIFELSSQNSVRQGQQKSPYEQPLRHTNILSNQYDLKGQLKNARSTPNSERRHSTRSLSGRHNIEQKNLLHRRSLSSERSGSKYVSQSLPDGNEKEKKVHEKSDSRKFNMHKLEHFSPQDGFKKTTMKRRIPAYMKIPEPFVVTAYKNGYHENGVRVSATNFVKLLELCTTRLHLTGAAKRLFLIDGTEITNDIKLPRGTEVFVSLNEPFKDPSKDARNRMLLKSQLSWSLSGICFPEEKNKETTRPKINDRLDTKNVKRRILVFLNGKGFDGVEFICDLQDKEDLLSNCTQKFNLGQQYRRLFLINGQEVVETLHDVPEIDPLLNNSIGTPLLGPVWVTKGEKLSPSGVDSYIIEVINFIKAKKKITKNNLEQLHLGKEVLVNLNLDKKQEIKDQRVLSLSPEIIDEEINKENDKLVNYNTFLKQHNALKKSNESDVNQEKEEGSRFTMQHIAELPEKHNLRGKNGLKLIVHENGTDDEGDIVYFNLGSATRGLKSNQDCYVFQRLMDTLSENLNVASKNSQSRGLLVRRIFTRFGKEINSVKELQREDHVWISHGENWIDPNAYCVQVILDSVIQKNYNNDKIFTIRQDFTSAIQQGMEKYSNWSVVSGTPDSIKVEKSLEIDATTKDSSSKKQSKNKLKAKKTRSKEKKVQQNEICDFEDYSDSFDSDDSDSSAHSSISSTISNKEEETQEITIPKESIPADLTYLHSNQKEELVVFPEVIVGIKKSPSNNEVWPKGNISQIWTIHQSGHICLKAFPYLSLAITKYKVDVNIFNEEVSGYLVQFEEKRDYSPDQQWMFHTDGLIYSKSEHSLALTYFGGIIDDPSSLIKNQTEEWSTIPGLHTMLGAAAPFEHHRKYQRFALKQEKFENFGQWRFNKVKNPEWSKKAFSWPIDNEGCWIEQFEWPMEAYFMTCAPPLTLKNKKDIAIPKRLFCMKNGGRDEVSGVLITGPDLTNLKKDKSIKNKKSNKSQNHFHSDVASIQSEDNYLHVQHCNDWTISKLEFQLFLERCTALLCMNTPARRLFDKNGVELFSLKDLERDQLIYVSSGEMWLDPKLSKKELEERALLVKLAEDVSKIKSYVTLRNCDNLVLAATDAVAGAKIVIKRNVLSKKYRRQKALKEMSSPPDLKFDSSSDDDSNNDVSLTAHQRACHRSDEIYTNKFRWPWERIVNDDLENSDDDKNYATHEHTSSSNQEFGSVSSKQKAKLLKEFVLHDQCIVLNSANDLTITVSQEETTPLSITLEKRKPDLAVSQKWTINNGYICLKYRPHICLTVQLPKMGVFDPTKIVSYDNAVLVAGPIKNIQFGRSNQMFEFDEEHSHLVPFASNSLDKAVTAANASGCCTYTLSPNETIDQPGYIVYLPTESKVKQFEICFSCAKALRGKFKLQKIDQQFKSGFICAFGNAKQYKIKEKGSFVLLNGKVDISDGDATASLKKWENEILSIRENFAVKSVSNRLSAAKTPRPIKILAYRNGEGRLSKPVPIISSSVLGIIEQCTVRLGYSNAVQKIFLSDGTPIYDIQDLQNWYYENKREFVKRQKEIQEGHLQPELEKIKEDIQHGKYKKIEDESSDSADNRVGRRQIAVDDMMPKLRGNRFYIGSNLSSPFTYTLGISLFAINFMENVVSSDMLQGDHQYVLRYNIFGQEIDTDPFTNEQEFNGEKREVGIRSELNILKEFFNTKLKVLEIKLLILRDDNSHCLATCYVPLDGIIREEQEEFLHSAEIGGDYALYLPIEGGKSRGKRTRSSVYVKVDMSIAEDASEDFDDENNDDVNKTDNDIESPENSSDHDEEDEYDEINVSNLVFEVWASTGEAFIPLSAAHRQVKRMLKERNDLADTILEKDIDKHIVRMMQGRRIQGQEHTQLRPTANPDNPVVVEGGWQTPRNEELLLHNKIHVLKEKEDKIRTSRSTARQANVDFSRSLYKQTIMLRVNAFINGDDIQNAVSIWGETIQQILDNATMRLGLRRPAKMMFDVNGKQILEFDQLDKDQMVCVSMGEQYMKQKAIRDNVEIKANWGRARKQYGRKATDFHVQARSHPIVEVDPFGPPLHGSSRGLSSTRSNNQPSFESKRVLVYENGRHKDSPTSVWGSTLSELLQNATKRLNLRKSAVCFYSQRGNKIISFDEISRDDLLAVSTTGKTYLKS